MSIFGNPSGSPIEVVIPIKGRWGPILPLQLISTFATDYQSHRFEVSLVTMSSTINTSIPSTKTYIIPGPAKSEDPTDFDPEQPYRFTLDEFSAKGKEHPRRYADTLFQFHQGLGPVLRHDITECLATLDAINQTCSQITATNEQDQDTANESESSRLQRSHAVLQRSLIEQHDQLQEKFKTLVAKIEDTVPVSSCKTAKAPGH